MFTLQMAEMRHLLFGKEGSSSQLPWPSWKQGIFFCDRAGLSFGLVQRQGGPCGLLAAVQVCPHCPSLCTARQADVVFVSFFITVGIINCLQLVGRLYTYLLQLR